MDDIFRRPHQNDTEEDILQLQTTFLASQTTAAAATVVKAKKRDIHFQETDLPSANSTTNSGYSQNATGATTSSRQPPPVKKSRFKSSRPTNQSQSDNTSHNVDMKDEPSKAVLSEIVERDVSQFSMTPMIQSNHTFPPVVHRGQHAQVKLQATAARRGNKKMSLFAQQFHCQPTQSLPPQESDTTPPSSTTTTTSAPPHPTLTPHTSQEIHDENLAKIASMSHDEILQEQNSLLKMLDPKMVEFIKSRRSAKPPPTTVPITTTPSTKAQPTKTTPTNAPPVTTLPTTLPVSHMNTDVAPDGLTDTMNVMMDKSHTDIAKEVPIDVDGRWVHMNQIEGDKLAWMKDLPSPSVNQSQTGESARFDFGGNFMATDAEVPVHMGLHHHGDDPERAGYTLEELFHLSRSSNPQQRSLSLHTIAAILRRAKRGDLSAFVATPILPTLLEGGLVFLLRWAIDDRTDAVVYAGIDALQAVIVNELDKEHLDAAFSHLGGCDVVCHAPVTEATKADHTDADVVKNDVIYALVHRMELLTRFYYILNTQEVPASTVQKILSTGAAIARHSPAMAYQIYQQKNLLKLIVNHFLPSKWQHLGGDQIASAYGIPLPSAVKLLRVLAQAGRSMAGSLVADYGVMDRITQYLVLNVSDIGLPRQESFQLQLECLRLWTVLLRYGHSTVHFVDLCQMLMGRVHEIPSRISNSWRLGSDTYLPLDVGLVGVVEAAVCCTAQHMAPTDRNNESEPVHPVIDRCHVSGFVPPITTCLQLSLQQITNNYQFHKTDLRFAASCMSFLSTFYTTHNTQQSGEILSKLQELEILWNDTIQPFTQTMAYQTISQNLVSFSNLLVSENHKSTETTPNLPQHGVTYYTKDDQSEPTAPNLSEPILHPHGPFMFMTSLVRLGYTICNTNKALVDQITATFTTNEAIQSYLRRLVKCRKSPLTTSHFTRAENLFLYYYLKLCALKPISESPVPHTTSLHLLTHLLTGDEHLAHDVLSTITFNINFFSEHTNLPISELSLTDPPHITSATRTTHHTTTSTLLQESCACLPDIRSTYLTILGYMAHDLHQSRARFTGNPHQTETFFSTKHLHDPLLPFDWPFLPLTQLYSQSQSSGGQTSSASSSTSSAASSAQANRVVRHCLRWLHLLESWRQDVMGGVSLALKFSRLLCVFLAGPDLFLDGATHNLLEALLRLYTTPSSIERLDLSEDIPGLSSFLDLYTELIEHYDSVSFGDPLFANYLLLPLIQTCDPRLKTTLWGDHVGVMRALGVPLNQLAIPLEHFLDPDESNPHLLHLYTRALLSGHVTPRWAPVPYVIAIHHVNRYLYLQEGREGKVELWKQILSLKNCALRKHLLYYRQSNMAVKSGLDVYSELPPLRQKWMEGFTSDMR